MEKSMNKIAAAFYLLLLISGCSSQPNTQELKEVPSVKLLRSADPAQVLPAFTTFSWNDSYHIILSRAGGELNAQLKEYIRSELIAYLQSRGYRYQSDPAQAEVIFGFLYAVQNTAADKGAQEKFGQLPGGKAHYSKATFMLSVLDAELQKVYWRAALQGADLEKEPQRRYIQALLQVMLSGIPDAGR